MSAVRSFLLSAPCILLTICCVRFFVCQWAYGVTLWELMTLGNQPYANIDAFEMLNFLKQGHRVAQPVNCPDELFTVIACCWALSEDERPSFGQLIARLAEFLNALSNFVWRAANVSKFSRSVHEATGRSHGQIHESRRLSGLPPGENSFYSRTLSWPDEGLQNWCGFKTQTKWELIPHWKTVRFRPGFLAGQWTENACSVHVELCVTACTKVRGLLRRKLAASKIGHLVIRQPRKFPRFSLNLYWALYDMYISRLWYYSGHKVPGSAVVESTTNI